MLLDLIINNYNEYYNYNEYTTISGNDHELSNQMDKFCIPKSASVTININ